MMVICGTGHRPDKLGGHSSTARDALRRLASHALEAYPSETHVITGMALGWDTALGFAAADRGLIVHAAVPFPGQDSKWPPESRREYRELLARCSSVTEVHPGPYAVELMQLRNVWMVDRAHRVLALWNGTPGGTANCVEYAQAVGKPIDNVWSRFESVVAPAIHAASAVRHLQAQTGLGILEIRKALELHGWDEYLAVLHLTCAGQLVAGRPGSLLPCGCVTPGV